MNNKMICCLGEILGENLGEKVSKKGSLSNSGCNPKS